MDQDPKTEQPAGKGDWSYDFGDPESCEKHAAKIEEALISEDRPVTYFGRALIKDFLGRALELRRVELEKSPGNTELRDKVANLTERVVDADNLLAAAQLGHIK